MAKTDIKYQCGCRFITVSLEEAVKHAEKTGHTLTVLGTIKPS